MRAIPHRRSRASSLPQPIRFADVFPASSAYEQAAYDGMSKPGGRFTTRSRSLLRGVHSLALAPTSGKPLVFALVALGLWGYHLTMIAPLALTIFVELSGAAAISDAKYRAKVEKVLGKSQRQVEQFKTTHRLNFYKKSRMANAFLWVLKDEGCPNEFAAELTDWLTLRL